MAIANRTWTGKHPADGVTAVVLEGAGLHTGARCRVTLALHDGPVVLRVGREAVRIPDLRVATSFRSTTVEATGGRLRLGMVEHLFAALAGMGVRYGLLIDVQGAELPLLDGGAAEWCEALAALGPPASPPGLRIERRASLPVGESLYEFEPGEQVRVEVQFETGDPRLTPSAHWGGDAADFFGRIAPARTFVLEKDLAELRARGMARHVDPDAVIAVARDVVHHAGRAFEADEPARHKLLDLLGDAYVYGGPPLGRVRVLRPGHAANAEAFAWARASGVFVAT
jgi:UDP-3-O-[3-hydroxymyristoyl] N-acetylglucosamine deacetylase